MGERKYSIDGTTVNLQYTSLYINRKAMKWGEADLSEVPEHFHPSKDLEDRKKFASFLVDTEQYVCGKCGKLYPMDTGGAYPFAGVMCQECVDRKNHCPENDSHDFECINPHQRHNARVDTKYKCKHCGQKKVSPATG